jgi:RNA polymerase Rpb6
MSPIATIDCERVLPNRFELVLLAAARACALNRGETPLVIARPVAATAAGAGRGGGKSGRRGRLISRNRSPNKGCALPQPKPASFAGPAAIVARDGTECVR